MGEQAREFEHDYAASAAELSPEEWLSDLKAGDDYVGHMAQALAEAYGEMGRPDLTPEVWRALATIVITGD